MQMAETAAFIADCKAFLMNEVLMPNDSTNTNNPFTCSFALAQRASAALEWAAFIVKPPCTVEELSLGSFGFCHQDSSFSFKEASDLYVSDKKRAVKNLLMVIADDAHQERYEDRGRDREREAWVFSV